MSIKNTIENYKYAEQLHQLIDDVYNQVEADQIPELKIDPIISKTLSDINRLKNTLNKVNVNDLIGTYKQDLIDDVEHNVNLFYEAADTIEKRLLARKYYNSLLSGLEKYLNEIDHEGFTSKDIANIFMHKDNIMDFINHIKRIALGTMSLNEFKKIYQTIIQKSAKINGKVLGSRKSFESLNNSNKMKILTLEDYQNGINEDFYNPFDEIDVDTSPKMMTDKGGLLKSRKETFNNNRIEYTKRTNGQYTILSKDNIAKGEIVEICPVMMCGIEVKAIEGIKDLIFEIDRTKQQYGMVLGYGSLYQHSETPNMEFGYNKSNKQMYFTAIRMIKAGEELTINYGKDYWDERKNFSTMAPLPQPEKVEPENESMGLQQNANDITGEIRTKQFGAPNNPANPAISGRAILAGGQS